MATDEQMFKGTVQQLRSEMKKRLGDSHKGIAIKSKADDLKSNSHGWYAIVATWKGYPPVELWFDRSLGKPERHYWFGFGVTQKAKITKLFQAIPVQSRPKKTLSDSDWHMVGANYEIKRSSLTTQDMSWSVYECYPGAGYYWGMFDPVNYGAGSEAGLFNVNRAANFICSAIEFVDPEEGDEEPYAGREGGRAHRMVETPQRCAKAARHRKEKDNHVCSICAKRCIFEFQGEEKPIERTFSEAHHIVPISKIDVEREVKLEDLRTVCPNCHRMLHKMNGTKADMEALRKIVHCNS